MVIVHMYNKTKLTLLATTLLVAGCHHGEIAMGSDRQLLQPVPLENPTKDKGAVIAQAHLIGQATAGAPDASTSDCNEATGYGVQVDMITAEKKYLFDRDGDPCKHSETLFDGKMKLYKRAADPSVNITFIDKYGKLPEKDMYLNTEALNIIDIEQIPTSTPEDAAQAPFTGAERHVIEYQDGVVPTHGERMNVDQTFEPVQLMPPGTQMAGRVSDAELAGAVNRWKEDKAHNEIVKQAEHLLAGVRDLSRKSSDELLEEHQKQIKSLLVQLRGAEKVIEYQKEKERRLKQEIEKGQRTLTAERRDRQQVERKVDNVIAQKEQRAKEYEMIAHDLKRKHIETVRTQEERMLALRKDLAQAEMGASTTRQNMILQAAQKIAEAEAIAQAARLDKRDAMERESNRLFVDASTVMRRAMEIDAGQSITIPAFDNLKKFEVPAERYQKKILILEERLAALEAPKAVEGEVISDGIAATHPMEGHTVILKEEDQTLNDVMKHTLGQLSNRIGDWKIEWRLTKEYASIPQEKWTVIAEARFDEFLAYVQGKVKQTHGVTLTFKRFDNSKLFVISD
tara:strand:+ start:172860 stop:174566 length:1707 start_codon:yes stop_codon:yes gene_type:complete